MRKKKEGDTLGEKIQNYLEKLKKKDVSQLIEDAFYERVHENGIPFYVRKTDVLRDMKILKSDDVAVNVNKTMQIVDEMLLRQEELKESAMADALRD